MPAENIVVVLYQPRDVRNIGGVVRAMLNTGLARLRLVKPPAFEATDILGIAHRSGDVLAQTAVFNTLDEALADASYVLGTSARTRAEHAIRSDVRTLAAELRGRAEHEIVALLFGPEDNGLDNDALDRCHAVLKLPVDPAYPSLNLAQAVLLLGYELWMVSEPTSSTTTTHATTSQLETLFSETEQALRAIEFFKSGSTSIMRSLRQAVGRAALTEREAMLLTAIAREVQRFGERKS